MPTSYDSDDLTNLEAGWKTTLWGGRLQFNGAIYQEKWKNVQSSIFAPQLGFPNLTATVNGPEYEVNGVEMSVVVAPMDGLTVQAAGSYNKGELQNSPQFISNNPASPTFGQPVTDSCLIYSRGDRLYLAGAGHERVRHAGHGTGELAAGAVEHPGALRVGHG